MCVIGSDAARSPKTEGLRRLVVLVIATRSLAGEWEKRYTWRWRSSESTSCVMPLPHTNGQLLVSESNTMTSCLCCPDTRDAPKSSKPISARLSRRRVAIPVVSCWRKSCARSMLWSAARRCSGICSSPSRFLFIYRCIYQLVCPSVSLLAHRSFHPFMYLFIYLHIFIYPSIYFGNTDM